MNNRIARRLILYFAAVLLLLSLTIGAVFIMVFRSQIMKSEKSDLEARAVSIAGVLSDYMNNAGAGAGGMMGGGRAGYGAYLRLIDDIAMSDVWVVDENLNLITEGQMSGVNYNYADLPPDADRVVKEVFEGKITFSEGFSGLFSAPTLTVGTPIETGGRIVGVVLLHAPVEGINDATMRGVGVLAVSLLAALALSVLLSVFFAFSFTRPLNKMKNTALVLAEGNYSAKTGVLQNDEIGELAAAIDMLSEELLDARREGEKLDQMRP